MSHQSGPLYGLLPIPSQLRIRLPFNNDIVVDVWGSLTTIAAVADGIREGMQDKDYREPDVGLYTKVVLAFHPEGRAALEAHRQVIRQKKRWVR